jgi:Putative lumazine-binding
MNDGDDHAVAGVLDDYQLAVATGDRARFATVFHPDATVSYPDRLSGALVTVSAQAFAAEVVDMVAAGTTVREDTVRRIIDVAGAVAAVRVDFLLQIAEESFVGTDLFSLAKTGDTWSITQKLYDMQPTAEPD